MVTVTSGDVEARRAYGRARDKAIREGTWQPQWSVSEKIPCAQCGKLFRRAPANRTKRGENNYCSRACMAAAFTGRPVAERHPRWRGFETRPCDSCGTLITRPAWAWDTRKMTFCDSSCFGKWKAVNWTGNANPAWSGGKLLYYGANWKRQQREARRRDRHECQFCGVSESGLRRALDVHHIIPFRFYGVERYREANRLANLVSLCDSCHTFLERFCRAGKIADWPSLLEAGRKASNRKASRPTVTVPLPACSGQQSASTMP